MIFQKANQFLRKGKMQEALKEYKKIKTDSPLYQQAKFNIDFIEKKLSDSGIQLSIVQKSYGNISTDCEGPLVSVVMPVFNVAPYLDASILSVLNQTYQNIELIIVDDASTDNGMNIIKMYERQDDRIKVISLRFNTLGGAGIPSNIGVSAATGKYVAYADSDDILNKEAIASFVKVAEENDAEVVIADFCNFDDENRILQKAYDKDRWANLPLDKCLNPLNYPELFRLSPVPWRKLYKRSYLEKNSIKFPEGDYFYEDNPLHWFVLASATKVVLTDIEVAYHRMAREGQTMGADLYKLSAQFCHLNTIRKYLVDNNITSKTYWKELSDFAYRANWIVERQDNNLIKNLMKKRYYQTAKKINEDANFTDNEIIQIRPSYLKRCKEYDKAYPEKDLAIVIPIYNCMDLFPQLIEDLLKIDIDSEIFLIDDGSTDGSTELCQKYADDNDNVFAFSQNNKGAGVARNAVIPLISAKYTYFVDADDEVDIANLVKATNFAIKNNHDLVLFKYRLHFYDKNVYEEMWKSDQEIWSQFKLAKTNNERKKTVSKMVNYPWIRIIETQLLHDEKIFFGKTVVHNDVPFHWHSIIAAKNIGIFDEAVCSHRKFEQREQITNINDSRRLAVLEAFRYTDNVLKNYDDYSLMFDSWQKSARDFINWARTRIPEENLEYFKGRQKEIVESLKKGLM